jgi:cystathionine beta-lyase
MTGCAKWDTYEADVIPMWVADMDFISPEPVIQALHKRVSHGVFGYPKDEIGDADCLHQVFVERLNNLYGWKVEPEELIFIPGVIPGFFLACHALATPSGKVMMMPPAYPPFLEAPASAGMARQDVQLTQFPNGAYGIDWDSMEEAARDETRLFILCNPHNPVGRVFREDELLRMAEVCLRQGVVICSDEIHCDLVYPGYRHIPIASLDPEIAQNTITLMAPSKTFNLAGLKCAVAIIQNPDLRGRFQKTGRGLVSEVNVLGLAAAQAAYQHGQEWLDQLMIYLEGNRDWLDNFVAKELPGVSMVKPEATYLAWLDCRELNLKPTPYEFFLKIARVALGDGAIFGKGGEGFVRLNFGCPRSMLMDALGRMKRALGERKSGIPR